MSQHKNSINEYQNKIRLVREIAILTGFILMKTQLKTFSLIIVVCLDMSPQQAPSAMATHVSANYTCVRSPFREGLHGDSSAVSEPTAELASLPFL